MAYDGELISMLRTTIDLLEKKHPPKPSARERFMEPLNRLREAADGEQARGIYSGPAEEEYLRALQTAGAVLDFLGTRQRGLQPIPKPSAPKAPAPQCQYCGGICWTRADQPLCLECWTYFEKYFSGADPGPDRYLPYRCFCFSPSSPEFKRQSAEPTLAQLFPLEECEG